MASFTTHKTLDGASRLKYKHIWGLDLGGNNALLTGDIGSGKSTLVDAVTALMVPRANFNKAAGATAAERSIETYFFGRYKSERGEPGLSSNPVSLRGTDTYSVLLGRFFNEALAQHVTLARVFWAKAPQGPPAAARLDSELLTQSASELSVMSR